MISRRPGGLRLQVDHLARVELVTWPPLILPASRARELLH